MRFYRNWSFGPRTAMRVQHRAQLRYDFLDDGGQNFALGDLWSKGEIGGNRW